MVFQLRLKEKKVKRHKEVVTGGKLQDVSKSRRNYFEQF